LLGRCRSPEEMPERPRRRMMGVLAARAAKTMQPLQSLKSLRIVKAKVKDSFQHESQPKSVAELPAALLKSQGQGSWEMGPCGESSPCEALPSAEAHKETDPSEPPQQPRTAKPLRSKPAVLAEATNRALKPIRKPKQYAQMLSEPDAEPCSGRDFDLEALPAADAADVAPTAHADADAEHADHDCSALPVPVRATTTSATAESQEPIVGPIDFGFGTLTLDKRPDLALPLMTVKYEKASINDAVMKGMFEAVDSVLALNMPFMAIFDLRSCALPGRGQLRLCSEWGKRQWETLETNLVCFAIILSGSMMRSTITMMLKMGRPTQRHGVFTKPVDAEAFTRQQPPLPGHHRPPPVAGAALDGKPAAAAARNGGPGARGQGAGTVPVVVTAEDGQCDSGEGGEEDCVGEGEKEALSPSHVVPRVVPRVHGRKGRQVPGSSSAGCGSSTRVSVTPLRSPVLPSESPRAVGSRGRVISMWSTSPPQGGLRGGLRGGTQPDFAAMQRSSAKRSAALSAAKTAGCCGGVLSRLLCGGGGGAIEEDELHEGARACGGVIRRGSM